MKLEKNEAYAKIKAEKIKIFSASMEKAAALLKDGKISFPKKAKQ